MGVGVVGGEERRGTIPLSDRVPRVSPYSCFSVFGKKDYLKVQYVT